MVIDFVAKAVLKNGASDVTSQLKFPDKPAWISFSLTWFASDWDTCVRHNASH